MIGASRSTFDAREAATSLTHRPSSASDPLTPTTITKVPARKGSLTPTFGESTSDWCHQALHRSRHDASAS